MTWVLRHRDAGEAVVDATIWAFLPELHPVALAPFVHSKWAALNGRQRAAVTAFLEAMTDHHPDADAALSAWLAAQAERDDLTELRSNETRRDSPAPGPASPDVEG